MTNWLPPTEQTIKNRCARSNPWLIGLLVGIFGPIAFVFSYRQRTWVYAVYYLVTSSLIIGIRLVFPTPPLSGSYVIPLINWIVYSSYGPNLIHGLTQFFIAIELKLGRSTLPNKRWKPSILFSFDEVFRKSQVKGMKPFEETNDISRAKLKELKELFSEGLITEDEYNELRKKTLGL